MTLLRFEDEDGNARGVLSLLALHTTSLGNKNTLISSDNKGFAAYLFEEEMETDYAEDKTFVAGFGQSEAGDVSPNVFGYPDGVMDYPRMAIIGNKMFEFAKELYTEAEEELNGDIGYRHKYIDMSDIQIDPHWIPDKDKQIGGEFGTCKAAIGISKIAGSTEDGKGIELIKEGLVYDSMSWPRLTLLPEEQKCHKEKVILMPTGRMEPHPWTPNILPIQIARIGKLGLIAVPFECTVMAGRRLKQMIKANLPDLEYLVIAGYANAYAGYTATREEYAAQHYEGASTHFGPFTLNAYRQEFDKLAKAMANGNPVESQVQPPDLSNDQFIHTFGVILDAKPGRTKWGGVLSEPQDFYFRGQTVRVCFVGAHPNNDFKTQDTYLKVEHLLNGQWQVVARDWDPETIFRWKRHGIAESRIWIEWTIPYDTDPGIYRISHFGNRKSRRLFKKSKIKPYSGTTREFEIR
jgi:neutral ceramidase